MSAETNARGGTDSPPTVALHRGRIVAAKQLSAEHGIVCRLRGEYFGYFGWPSVDRLDDGTLIVASSGLRSEHPCPWGKTVINMSTDDGQTWSTPRVVHDSPLDDRDAGVLNLGGQRLLISWASVDVRDQINDPAIKQAFVDMVGAEEVERWRPPLEALSDDDAARYLGSWVMHSSDGAATWDDPIRVPVYTPHGPIRLRSGQLLYLGKRFVIDREELDVGPVAAARSDDDGRTWTELGRVPIFPDTLPLNYAEPHVVELPSGKLLGMIRVSGGDFETLSDAGVLKFSMAQSESTDGGLTWTTAKPLNFPGSPPHLMRHSSGRLVLTYGFRLVPYGQRVAISDDDGATWDHDWTLRDDGPDWDLGYPSTVELADGRLFTVCYQKAVGDAKCSLLWSRWQLP